MDNHELNHLQVAASPVTPVVPVFPVPMESPESPVLPADPELPVARPSFVRSSTCPRAIPALPALPALRELPDHPETAEDLATLDALATTDLPDSRDPTDLLDRPETLVAMEREEMVVDPLSRLPRPPEMLEHLESLVRDNLIDLSSFP